MKEGTRLNTPSLSKMMAEDENSFVRELIEHGEKTLGDDWENYEDEECTICHGTGEAVPGSDDPHCVACEGTGIWYRMYYGVSGGLPFAYTDEWGIEFMKKCAAEYRSAHTQMQLAGKTPSHFRPYLLPKTLMMELQARGYDPLSKDEEEKKKIMNVVAREYPEFMCVNYKNF